jgi:hypothetical protein
MACGQFCALTSSLARFRYQVGGLGVNPSREEKQSMILARGETKGFRKDSLGSRKAIAIPWLVPAARVSVTRSRSILCSS